VRRRDRRAALGPPEYSVQPLDRRHHQPARLFSDWSLVQSIPPAEVAPVWVGRSRHAVGLPSASRFFLNRLHRESAWIPANPLSEFDLRLEHLPTRPSLTLPTPKRQLTTSSSHGLSLPTAHQDPKVHLTRILPARYVPPSGFGYPLDGFLPSHPCRLCFAPAALLGFPFGVFPSRKVTARLHAIEPTYRFPELSLPPSSGGPANPAAVPGL